MLPLFRVVETEPQSFRQKKFLHRKKHVYIYIYIYKKKKLKVKSQVEVLAFGAYVFES